MGQAIIAVGVLELRGPRDTVASLGTVHVCADRWRVLVLYAGVPRVRWGWRTMTEGNDLMVCDGQLSLMGCSSCGGILSPHWERRMFAPPDSAWAWDYAPVCPECDGKGGR